MTDANTTDTLPIRVSTLIEQATMPLPRQPGEIIRPDVQRPLVGVTDEIAQQARNLNDEEIQALCDSLISEADTSSSTRDRTVQQLITTIGAGAVPALKMLGLRALAENEPEDSYRKQKWTIETLGKIGEPAISALNEIFVGLTSQWLIRITIDIFFEIGEPAAKAIALALEHPDAASATEVLKKAQYHEETHRNVSIGLANAIAFAVIEELVIRTPSQSDRFNDVVVAQCLLTLIERSPQLRSIVQEKLCYLAFQDSLEVRNRAIQVITKIDLEDFLHRIRLKADAQPEIANQILYQLGEANLGPTQSRYLDQYADQLKKLEEKSLERWDEMAKQSKFNFWFRNVLTGVFFAASLIVLGAGLVAFFSAKDATTQAIGAVLSALTTLAGMWLRAWQAPVGDIRDSFVQQAAVEATFMGFMNRTGQIRLFFQKQ